MTEAGRAAAFVGRQQELERFASCLSQARSGVPSLLVFEGEPGSGKTSLLDAIERSTLLGKGSRIARVNLADADQIDPVSYAADALTHSKWYARVGGRRRFAAITRKLLPDWMGAIPVFGDLFEAIVVTGQAITKRRKGKQDSAVAEDIDELQRTARRRTLVIMIDDLHLASEASVDRLLRLLSRATTGARLLLVGAARTPKPGATRQPFRTLLDRLPSQQVAHDRLDTLSYTALQEWMAAIHRDAPLPAAVIAFLLAETGGQPGAVLQLHDRLLETGALQPTPGGWTFDQQLGNAQLEAADSVETVMRTLRPEIAETVRIASIFGDEFDTLFLGQVLGVDELELEDRLAAAVRFGLIAVAGEWTQPNGDISTRYRFVSSAARAALHRSLSAERRSELESRMLAAQ